MATWTNLGAGELGVDTIIKATTGQALYDNVTAAFEKASGAPQLATNYIVSAMIAADQITTAKIANSNVTTAKIASGNVTQSRLATTTGTGSTTAVWARSTLPGGTYGFLPQTRDTLASSNHQLGAVHSPIGADGASRSGSNISASYTSNWEYGCSASGNNGWQQRYVTASPPYDLGDGAVPMFVFAVIDNATGRPVMTWAAPDPPWANNGPTSVRVEVFDAQGRGFKRIRRTTMTLAEARTSPVKMRDYLAELDAAVPELVEVTQAVKQADMPLIPHPFSGNDMTGRTLVIMDPVAGLASRLLKLQESGEADVSELLIEDYLRFDNVALTRAAPPGVQAVALNWRLT